MSTSLPAHVLHAFREANYDVSPRYLPRLLKMVALGVPMVPAGVLEQLLYRDKIANTELAGPPVFILGHWRTGSTHLHNLLSQDPQFGYLSTFDAFTTNNLIVGRKLFKEVIRRMTPERRPMDDMSLDLDLPQEEEYAMANLSRLSYHKQYSFPRMSEDYARRHIFFDDVPQSEIDAWKRTYDFLLRKITYVAGPKPLVLKNPPNTARLRHLLDLYPDAKVIYLYRDPYTVYLSTLRMREKICETTNFHDLDKEQMSEHILATYPRMVERFFADLPRVRQGNFIALRYEDMKARPLKALEQVYEALSLKDFGKVRERLRSYLGTVADFRPAKYTSDDIIRRKVEERWHKATALHERFRALESRSA